MPPETPDLDAGVDDAAAEDRELDEAEAKARTWTVRDLSRASRTDFLCLTPIALKSIYYYAGIPVGTALQFTQPLLAELLRGSSISLIIAGAFAAGGRLPLWAVLLAPIPYTMLTDPFYYWAGRRYGRRVVGFLEVYDRRWHKRAMKAERAFHRFGLWTILVGYFLPVPNDLLYFAAGDARIAFVPFILVDFVGTLMYIGLWIALGWVLGAPARSVADTLGKYSWYITLGLIGVIFAWSMVSAWRSSGEQAAS